MTVSSDFGIKHTEAAHADKSNGSNGKSDQNNKESETIVLDDEDFADF
jgi:hypothetical protein